MKGHFELAKHLPSETRNPILLPRKHNITTLIVAHHHEQRNHSAGINHVLSDIRTRLWIIRGREAVKSWVSRCNECKGRRTKTFKQIMGPLPLERLRMPMRAFVRCGVDYAGPFLTKQGRGKVRQKRYLCLSPVQQHEWFF